MHLDVIEMTKDVCSCMIWVTVDKTLEFLIILNVLIVISNVIISMTVHIYKIQEVDSQSSIIF